MADRVSMTREQLEAIRDAAPAKSIGRGMAEHALRRKDKEDEEESGG
jgi:hypothetical protein